MYYYTILISQGERRLYWKTYKRSPQRPNGSERVGEWASGRGGEEAEGSQVWIEHIRQKLYSKKIYDFYIAQEIVKCCWLDIYI